VFKGIAVDDGVVLIASGVIAMKAIVSDSPCRCSRHQELLGAAGPSEVVTHFFGWAARAIAPAACFEFRERRALA
jgi:hypothetical protein